MRSMGEMTDHSSEWSEKLKDVRSKLTSFLPARDAFRLFEHYSAHVDARRGVGLNRREARTYRKLMEFEETLLLWEEMRVNSFSRPNQTIL